MTAPPTSEYGVLAPLKRLLNHVGLYIALQKAVGADRVRYLCLETARLKPGERVLDVGCGPAYYFDRLPSVEYHGFDTSPAYVAYAQRRYGQRGAFHCEVLTSAHLADLPPFDAVLLFGLLHHLSDDDCATLLGLAAFALGPRGRVVSVDTCFHPGQGRISAWMSRNDRGGFVRTPPDFMALASAAFGEVTGTVVDTLSRIPASYYVMRMSSPTDPAIMS